MTLDELINSTVVCGDPVTVMSIDDDAKETAYFDDFTDELSDADFTDNDEILEREVTYIEAREIKGRPTLLITVESD